MSGGWPALAAAILCEVGGTVALRAAAGGRRAWYVAVVAGYLLSFRCLGLALGAGMPLGVAYGVWAAVGVALTALAGRVFFGERLTRLSVLGIACVVVGVVLVEAGGAG